MALYKKQIIINYPIIITFTCGLNGIVSIYTVRMYTCAYSWHLTSLMLNLLADNFIFSHYTGIFYYISHFPSINHIQCWLLIMTKYIWVVSKNRKNALCTPPLPDLRVDASPFACDLSPLFLYFFPCQNTVAYRKQQGNGQNKQIIENTLQKNQEMAFPRP